MDGDNFDSLTRKLGGLASRRQAVAGLVGAAVAATGLSAAAKNKGKSAKGKGHGLSAKDIRKGKGIGAAACGNAGCAGCSGGSQPFPDLSCPGGETPVCLPGTSISCGPGGCFTCGSGGAICSDCPTGGTQCLPNQDFNGGTCDTPPLQCNAFGFSDNTQCLLEVNGHATCQNAGGPNACGFVPFFVNGAGNCLPPCATGSQCVQDFSVTGFTCTNQTCQTTCAQGCCAGPTDPINPVGSCQPGDNILACGSGGGTCVDCLATCGISGSCVNSECSCLAPPPCGGFNQACCTTGTPCLGNNVCTNGLCVAPVECGALNQPCCTGNTCLGSNVCNNGLCEAPPPPPCSESCVGCCSNGQCLTGTSKGACGLGGVDCVACGGKQKCKNGVCKKKHHH